MKYKYRLTVRLADGFTKTSAWREETEVGILEWKDLLKKPKEWEYIHVGGYYFPPDKICYVRIEVKRKKWGIWWGH